MPTLIWSGGIGGQGITPPAKIEPMTLCGT